MADATVSILLDRLGPLIEKEVRKQVALLLNAKEEAQHLSGRLKTIQGVLADAESRLVKDPRVQSWLQKLQDIACQIEDVLDEWEVQNIKQQLDSESSSSSWAKLVCSFLQSVSLCLCFKPFVQRHAVALRIRQINQRLDSLSQENDREFGFAPKLRYDDPQHEDSQNENHQHTQNASFVDPSQVHGRDTDKQKLISMLLSETSGQGEDGVGVVSIVGAGGLGKTTLAQLVFNDDSVKRQFQERRIWVSVSGPFNETKIAKAIQEAIDYVSSSHSQLEMLLQAIEKSILGKKFLFVLDNVWTEDDKKWRHLNVSLRSGAPGTRILVTTRKEKVARLMGTQSNCIYILKPLKDPYCWFVLSQIAFCDKRPQSVKVEKIGREIAKKCKGFPLAATTMGSLLRFKSSPREWQSVLESEMWKLKEVRKDMFPLLKFSYDELDPAIKRCFSYCAIFPEDIEINVDELVRVWMAQGFLSSPSSGNEGDQMEDTGREYFDDLANRSFFHDFVTDYDDRIIWCRMHSVVREFAQFLMNNDCLVVKKVNGEAHNVSTKEARHLNMILQDEEESTYRTFISTCGSDRFRSFMCRYMFAPDLLTHLKRVRLLILVECGLQDLPEEIGKLIHIRYMDLSDNPIKDLPKTICDLYFLQTLGLKSCKYLGGLPEGIHKLKNLRHLLNYNTSAHFRFPQGFAKLTNLRRLDEFRATKGSGNKLGCLKDLNQLGGNIRIDIDNEVDVMEAMKADLKNKKMIRVLSLYCGDARLEIVEALQPHPECLTFINEAPATPPSVSSHSE